MGYHLRLAVIAGHNANSPGVLEHRFDESGGTVGRSARADWVLADAARLLSGTHCRIQFEHEQFFVVDLSTNGVYINGSAQRLGRGSMQALADGDHLRMGDFEFEVQVYRDFLGTGTADIANMLTGSKPLSRTGDIPTPDVRHPLGPGNERSTQMFDVTAEHPAPQAAPAVPGDGVMEVLLGELGLPADAVDGAQRDQFLRDLAGVVREAMNGMVAVLAARADMKNEFGAAVTQLRPSENNPLKHCPTGFEALRMLLVNRNVGYLSGADAVKQGFADIERHQLATLAGMKAGLVAAARQFDPGILETRSNARVPPWKQAFAARAHWQSLRDLYDSLLADDGEELHRVFQEAFAKAYDLAQRE